jgi:leucyl-tRNA---protein transferase
MIMPALTLGSGAMQKDRPPCLLQFYATANYPCSYLPSEKARSQVAIAADPIDTALYSILVEQGFRRSGTVVYRPYCDQCDACIPLRIPVQHFSPNRSQKRAWRRHEGLSVRFAEWGLREEHYALYRRYQAKRHQSNGMDHDSIEEYAQFLLESSVDTRLVEFRENGALRMVSFIDYLQDGLSSVYTFFDPDRPTDSLGTWNILWQIRECQAIGRPYLYLGYFIAACAKMAYKARFLPFESREGNHWVAHPHGFSSLVSEQQAPA